MKKTLLSSFKIKREQLPAFMQTRAFRVFHLIVSVMFLFGIVSFFALVFSVQLGIEERVYEVLGEGMPLFILLVAISLMSLLGAAYGTLFFTFLLVWFAMHPPSHHPGA